MKLQLQNLLLATTLLAGCSTTSMLRSYPAFKAGPTEGYELVGQYGLAKSHILVTISVAGGGEKKDPTPPQIAFTSSINVTTGETPSAKPDKPEETPRVETQASVCADIRKTYNQDRVAVLASYKRHVDFIADLQVWEGRKPSTEKELTAAQARLDGFILQRARDGAASGRLANLAPLIESCPQPVSIDMKELQLVDPTKVFRLYANKPEFGDNNITIEMSGGVSKDGQRNV